MLNRSFQSIRWKGRLADDPKLVMGQRGKFVLNFTLFVPTSQGKDAPASCVAFDKEAKEIFENGKKGGLVEVEAEFIQITKTEKETGKVSYENKFLILKVLGVFEKSIK